MGSCQIKNFYTEKVKSSRIKDNLQDVKKMPTISDKGLICTIYKGLKEKKIYYGK